VRPWQFRTRFKEAASMLLTPRAPFNFERTLRFILGPPVGAGRAPLAPLLDYFIEGEYRRVVEVGGQLILFGASQTRRRATEGLEVRILSGPRDPATQRAVGQLVSKQFSVQLDLAPFYRLAASDAVLARLVGCFRGMRIPQAPTVFETLLAAILEQQVNLSFAHQVKKALIESYGEPVGFEGRSYNSFPRPAALAIRTPRELRRIQISGPKARYLIGISQMTLDGTLDLETLRTQEPASALERLRELKGVGPWTAQYVGLRALGHLDSLPSADVGLQEVIRRLYGLRKRPKPERVERLARQWSGWRSYATFYLWMTFWEDKLWREQLIREIHLKKRGKPHEVTK